MEFLIYGLISVYCERIIKINFGQQKHCRPLMSPVIDFVVDLLLYLSIFPFKLKRFAVIWATLCPTRLQMSLILCFRHISMLLLSERFILVSEEVLGWAFVAFFSLETLLSGVSSRGRLFCPSTGCTLGCQKKLREEKDRWPLGLKSVLGCLKQRLRASAVLPESRWADAHAYAFPKWSCFYWG